MSIVLCGKCAYIGNENTLVAFDVKKTDLLPEVLPFIQKNSMYCRGCPSCGSTMIFYKKEPFFSIPSVWTTDKGNPVVSKVTMYPDINIPPFKSKIDDSKLPGYEYPRPSIERGQTSPEPNVDINPNVILSKASIEEGIDPDILSDIEEATKPKPKGRPKKKDPETENKIKELKENTKRIMNTGGTKKIKCDACKKEYEVKANAPILGGSGRCPECMEALMKTYG